MSGAIDLFRLNIWIPLDGGVNPCEKNAMATWKEVIRLSKEKKVVHYRDAEDGHYVTKKYAEDHPKTTVKETDKVPPKKGGK